MHRFAFAFALLLAACSSDDPSGSDSGRQRLEAATGDCQDVGTVCVETYPPQCYDVCNDDPPADDGGDDCVASDGDLVTCGDDTCVVGIDDSGQEVVICGGPDCVVAYDAETGEETITCPGDDGSGGGSDPGTGDGSGGGTEPYPGDE